MLVTPWTDRQEQQHGTVTDESQSLHDREGTLSTLWMRLLRGEGEVGDPLVPGLLFLHSHAELRAGLWLINAKPSSISPLPSQGIRQPEHMKPPRL